jgi:hypothetical protein
MDVATVETTVCVVDDHGEVHLELKVSNRGDHEQKRDTR